ncbi:ABC transporter ATP-binding protein [Halolamina salifodinae]|uniref:ATP-binding cassette subfamily B protein n=1 Tax=Halolamina salifodinae TaxID=1202767 RepID=A0A8T4GVV5_9EURY|nr:ABC transporter ATP-binding protein [Halolamina salifodinae]MBP1986580.1 ATP-binding cassette subfamily B protein [Halolamina salifodinae]
MADDTQSDTTTTDDSQPAQFADLANGVERPVRRLLETYYRPYLPHLGASVLLLLLARVLWYLPPAVLGATVDATLAEDAPYRLPFVPPRYLPTGDAAELRFSVFAMVGAFLGGALAYLLGAWVRSVATYRVQHDVRVDAYRITQRLRYGFFDNARTGELLSVLNNDVNTVERFFGATLTRAINAAFIVLVTAAYMLAIHPGLTLFAFVAPVVVGAVNYAYSRRIAPRYDDLRASVGDIGSRIEAALGGIDVVKAYGGEAREADTIAAESARYRTVSWRIDRAKAAYGQLTGSLTNLGYVAVFAVGGSWVLFGAPTELPGTLTAGTLVTFLIYVDRFAWPFQQLPGVVDGYQEMRAAGQRILALFEEADTVADDSGATTLDDVSGHVAYEDVTFGYPGADAPVLDGVSLDVPAGSTVGVVGATGAGKSTLLKLLLRFYDPDDGAVRIDGHDLRDLDRASLRESIGYVGQEPYLFDGTVRENVAYARPNASEAVIADAAERANAHGFVTDLPDGYDTDVGERGVKLSGGQRQRLSIARAVLADPRILVLDEATSHVDAETEARIQRSLDRLSEDRTTFVVAHRLSTVKDADRIVVLDEGGVAERGSHETLLEEDGLYAALWGVQVGEVDSLPAAFVN